MTHRSIFLWLKSQNHSFNIQDQVAQWLQEDFPHVEVVACEEFEELSELIPDADVVLTWYFEEPWFLNAPKLKWVFTPAAGHDWVPQDPLGRVDVHYGRFHGPLMAESLLAMMLYHQRNLPQILSNQQDKIYDRNAQSQTSSLLSKRVQIWGYGAIGEHCARVLQAMGCIVSGVCRAPSTKPNHLNIPLYSPLEAHSHLSEVDIIVSLIPASEETIMGTEFFHSLKNGVQFYSLGRGDAIDESSLLNVLNTGLVSFAGLDVFQTEPLPQDSPLWEHPKVLLTPHSACVMQDYGRLFYQEIHSQLQEIFHPVED